MYNFRHFCCVHVKEYIHQSISLWEVAKNDFTVKKIGCWLACMFRYNTLVGTTVVSMVTLMCSANLFRGGTSLAFHYNHCILLIIRRIVTYSPSHANSKYLVKFTQA